MKSKFILLGTVAGLSLLSAGNSNAHQQGWYIGVEAGANWIDDTDFSISEDDSHDGKYETDLAWGGGVDFDRPLDFDSGWAAFVTAGYGFDNNWRVELEGGYRTNDFSTSYRTFHGPSMDMTPAEATALHPTRFGVDGTLEEWTAMVNVIYDVPLAEKLDLSIGFGVGADFSNIEVAGLEDSDTNFAYQAIVGLNYKLTDRLDLTLNYRYLNVDSPSYAETVGGDVYTADLEDLEKHTVTVGLRYDLFADEAPAIVTPPAPPVPPPAAEPEQFVIFFGFNKCNITAEADAVLTEAAAAAKSTGAASILIVGHTDTMGSNSYNQKLSECRAGAAKSGLVAKGIGEGQISASGRGETELLVKTGDSVKEPQNRRATIDLSK